MYLKKILISIAVGLLGLLTTKNVAQAAYLKSLNSYSKADFAKEINSGSFVEEFNAASYIFDDKMAAYEIEINNIVDPATVYPNPYIQKQFLWKNGEKINFELSFNGEIIKYKVGEKVLSAVNVNQELFDINGIILKAQSAENSQVELTNLVFDDSLISTLDLRAEEGEIDFLKIAEINNSFTLTGTQVFSWKGARPEDFDLAYKISVGNFQEPTSNLFQSSNFSILSASIVTEVPEPKTVSLFSLLLVGMIIKHRRRLN